MVATTILQELRRLESDWDLCPEVRRVIAKVPAMLTALRRFSDAPCDHHGMSICPREEARAILRDLESA